MISSEGHEIFEIVCCKISIEFHYLFLHNIYVRLALLWRRRKAYIAKDK